MTMLFSRFAFVGTRHVLSRAMLAIALLGSVTVSAAHAAEDRAVAFMREAANALIQAQRQGSPGAFQRVVNKYGHVPAIGLYALGNFRTGLPRRHRTNYYRGLAKFVGRYAAQESPKYPVVRATFAPVAINDGRSILVDSRIHLQGGGTYDVRWMLIKHHRTYRVRDAQVLGFWISPFLQTLFEDFIKKHGGRVDALVLALNQ